MHLQKIKIRVKQKQIYLLISCEGQWVNLEWAHKLNHHLPPRTGRGCRRRRVVHLDGVGWQVAAL